MSDELLRLPFDQYQRYSVARALLSGLGVGPRTRVLEVGGAPGPLEAFLPDHEVVVTDLNGKRSGRYAQADGARLPFPDLSFDAVVTLDTLEHVPAHSREDFLSEARRVSRDLVVLSAPFSDSQLELAEDALNAFVRQRFGGDFPTLDEHREHGLPSLPDTVAGLGADGWATATLPSGYLPRWLLGMIFHHELLAAGMPELPDLHAYYNATVSALDCRAPSYRQVVVASRDRPSAELAAATDSLRSEGDEPAGAAALGAIATAVLARRLPAAPGVARVDDLRGEIGVLEAKVADLERQVADRDGHLVELRIAHESLLEKVADRQLLGLVRRAGRGLRGFSN